MIKDRILDEILKEAVILRDKKGKKLNKGSGICFQLYGQTCGRFNIRDIINVVDFFLGEHFPNYYPSLPKSGTWTPARRRLLNAIIEGLEDPKVRQLMTEDAIGF